MKLYVKELFLLTMLMILPGIVSAQMTIDQLEPTKQENVRFRDTVKQVTLEDAEYYSEARYRAERAALRKERNSLEIISSLQGSLTSYNDPWVATSGGDNTTAILGSFILNHSYKRDKLTLTTKISANLGFNRVKIDTGEDEEGNTISEGVWFKNQDAFSVTIAPTIAISPIWSYGPTATFRTQFADGYVSRSEQGDTKLKSGFMAPGYLDLSGAMTYKSPNNKLPFTISIAPLSLSATFVTNDLVKENFRYNFGEHTTENDKEYVEPYGVSYTSNSKCEGGSSIQIDFDRTFEKLSNIRYTTKIYSFYGWMTQVSYKNIVNDYDEYKTALDDWNGSKNKQKPMLGIQPTVRWESTLSIPTTKFLSTTIKFNMYYNRAQNLKIQTQTYLSVGLSYTYKNK